MEMVSNYKRQNFFLYFCTRFGIKNGKKISEKTKEWLKKTLIQNHGQKSYIA